ncbi:MAG: HDOD domain-containing protein [Cellvibrionaceae bacterium]|nr:HDOD domain-containing protein [Cellvibrionaceae bacterium]
MSVPSNIQQILDNYQIPYELADMSKISRSLPNGTTTLKPYNTACAQVLKEEGGGEEVLAIFPFDTFLDLKKLQQTLGKNYQPVLGEALQVVMRRCGVNGDKVPAMPILNNMSTLVDSRLLKTETVYLDIGLSQQYIQLNQQHFRQLLEQAQVKEIATSLAKLETPTSPDNDAQDIEYSVSLFTERRIKQRLEETLEFPPLPIIASKIIQLRVDPNADISDLTDIVELDASLSAQVVSWAASPYYSAPGTIKSIHDAIVRVLGFDMVLNLALGLSLGKTMKMPEKGPHGCLPYWQQSVYVAAAAEALVTCIPRASRPSFGTAYLAGLLNNFGYLVMAEVFDVQFKEICDHIDVNPQASVQAAERHIIGIDRNQLAAWLMGFWNMPEAVCIALRNQNDADYKGDNWQYPIILYLSNKLLQERGMFMGASTEAIPDAVFARLDITREAAEEAIENLLASCDELEAIAEQMAK